MEQPQRDDVELKALAHPLLRCGAAARGPPCGRLSVSTSCSLARARRGVSSRATAVLLGLICHFAVSIGWGLLFGLLFYGLSPVATVLAGLAWGIVVWLGMFYVVLPAVGLARMAAEAPLWRAIIDHVVFGLAVGIAFLPFQVEVSRRYRVAGRV